MGLDQGLHAPAVNFGDELAQVLVVQGRHDEQDGVRARGPRLGDLVRIDDEVLAQKGQLRNRARPAQIIQTAAEKRRIGQDRRSRGSGRLVDRQPPGDVGVALDEALRGRTPLEFRDARHTRGRAECLAKAARRRARGSLLRQIGQRQPKAAIADGTLGLVEDLVENHGLPGKGAINRIRSSTAMALPLSSASAAGAAPSRNPGAPPVTTRPAAAVMSAATRLAPPLPCKVARSMSAFRAGSPPLRPPALTSVSPKSGCPIATSPSKRPTRLPTTCA